MTAEEQELEKFLSNRFRRLNNLYWIMDDHGRKTKFKMKYVQYILYKALWWLNIILKSRQHGITTFISIFLLDACLFTPNVRAGIICHKLEDAKKIFRDKIKFAYEHLDPAFKIDGVLNLLKDDTMEIVFANNSAVSVGTSMRSGTLQYLHISEYGWICQHAPKRAREIKTGCLETVHEGGYVFIESTAEGVGDDFQHMCRLAEEKKNKKIKLTRMDYQFHFFPWFFKEENQLFDPVDIPDEMNEYFDKLEEIYDHKITDSYRGWYVKKKEVLREDIYKEQPSTPEEAFYASIEGTIFGRLMIAAKEDDRICFVPHDPNYRVYCAWDIGPMHTAIWFVQFIRNRINWIDFYEDNIGLGADEYAAVINSKRDNLHYVYSGHVCGPDMLSSNKKNVQTGKMTIDKFAELGIAFDVLEPHEVATRIGAMRSIVNMSWFDERKCVSGITHLFNYHYEKDEIASTEENTIFKKHPFHDASSHAADAAGHYALKFRICELEGTVPGGTTKPIRAAAHRPAEQKVTAGVTNLMEV